MNYKMIAYICGRLLMIQAGLMLAPLMVSFIYREELVNVAAFLLTMALIMAVGLALSYRLPENRKIYGKEGSIIVALTWILISLAGSLPFILAGEIPNVIDAVFETASGFTTTGASIVPDIEGMSKSLLFWRSETHLIGGMGVLVFAMAIFPGTSTDSVHLMRAEVPGPKFGKLVAKMRETARILYLIYFAMTAITIVLLLFGGLSLFDACIHAFGAAGTGGFSNYAKSVGHFNSLYVEGVLSVAMLLFGVNFNIFYLILIRQFNKAFVNEELRAYIGIVFINSILIALSIRPLYDSFSRSLRHSFFAVSSIITTSGYATEDFAAWPLFPQVLILLLMIVGACAGSTGGGLKVSRLCILFKAMRNEIIRAGEPDQIQIIHLDGKGVSQDEVNRVRNYFLTYLTFFVACIILVSPDCDTLMDAFSSVAATFNNIGPGLGSFGPAGNFAGASSVSKCVYILAMIAGRLEIYPVLLLLRPSSYSR